MRNNLVGAPSDRPDFAVVRDALFQYGEVPALPRHMAYLESLFSYVRRKCGDCLELNGRAIAANPSVFCQVLLHVFDSLRGSDAMPTDIHDPRFECLPNHILRRLQSSLSFMRMDEQYVMEKIFGECGEAVMRFLMQSLVEAFSRRTDVHIMSHEVGHHERINFCDKEYYIRLEERNVILAGKHFSFEEEYDGFILAEDIHTGSEHLYLLDATTRPESINAKVTKRHCISKSLRKAGFPSHDLFVSIVHVLFVNKAMGYQNLGDDGKRKQGSILGKRIEFPYAEGEHVVALPYLKQVNTMANVVVETIPPEEIDRLVQ